MIIENGTIRVKSKAQCYIDRDTGFVESCEKSTWSKPIPCQYEIASYNSLAKSDNMPYTEKHYTILIEMRSFKGEQISLFDAFGNSLGEFSIIQIKPLTAVDEIQITV
jgi:hypothetical protein|nr:MAG TPA: hypothetical protein [Bacteriophage sp.]